MIEPYPDPSIDETIKRRLPAIMKAAGVHTAMVTRIADQLCADIKEEHSGGLIYIKNDNHHAARERNKKIVAEFDGENHKILARKYGITTRTIYRIIDSDKHKKLGDNGFSHAVER